MAVPNLVRENLLDRLVIADRQAEEIVLERITAQKIVIKLEEEKLVLLMHQWHDCLLNIGRHRRGEL